VGREGGLTLEKLPLPRVGPVIRVIPRGPDLMIRTNMQPLPAAVVLARAPGVVVVQRHLPVALGEVALHEAAPASRPGRGLHPRPRVPRQGALVVALPRCRTPRRLDSLMPRSW